MKVSVLTIGNEILSGRTVNTNANFIVSRLYSMGFVVKHILTVSDERSEIIGALDYLIKDSEIVITTGGLGPTSDDISKRVISDYFEKELYFEEEIANYISNNLALKYISGNVREQAMIPKDSEYFINEVGTAPGILIKRDNVMLFMLPGVPKEMKYLLDAKIIPYLKERFNIEENVTFNFRTSTLPEVEIYDILNGAIEKADIPYIGYYPSYGVVDIRISGKEGEKNKLKRIRNTVIEKFHDYIFVEGYRNLEEILGEHLKAKGFTLSIAESITGGLIGNRITDIPGSSGYFLGGVISYSNYSKVKILHVSEHTIEEYGAVSKETCEEMLNGTRKLFNADCSIAVTGIAGPSGKTLNKPIGLVYIGVRVFDKSVIKRYTFSGNRNMIRERTCNYSMFLLIKLLETIL